AARTEDARLHHRKPQPVQRGGNGGKQTFAIRCADEELRGAAYRQGMHGNQWWIAMLQDGPRLPGDLLGAMAQKTGIGEILPDLFNRILRESFGLEQAHGALAA